MGGRINPVTGVTDKEEAYCQARAGGKNQTDAYLAAYNHTGTQRTAWRKAIEIEQRPKVQARLAELQQQVTAKAVELSGIDKARVLLELARIAFFDPRKLFNPDGSLKAVTELDDDAAAVLCGMDVSQVGGGETPLVVTTKLRYADKMAALTNAMRHLGMFDDKQTIKHTVSELSDDDLDARIARLAAGGAKAGTSGTA